LRARELLGKEVIGDHGSRIGKVRDVTVDVGSWQVKELEVDLVSDLAEELGRKKMFGTQPAKIKVEHIRGVADTVLLNISRSQLRESLQGKGLSEKEGQVAPQPPSEQNS
jgi:sporulation protein YlmC with PRC-barrel domain